MGKLMSRSFYYQKKDGDGKFKVEIKVSQAGEFYCQESEVAEEIRIKCPQLFGSHKGWIQDDTLSGFVRNIEKIIKKYEALNIEESREKVILYKILLQGDLTPELSGDDKRSKIFKDLDRWGSRGEVNLGFGTVWHVVWRYTMGDSVRYAWLNDTEISMDGFKEMPWTRERESWFEGLDDTLIGLITKVDQFLNVPDPLQLMTVIDNGGRFLEAPKKK